METGERVDTIQRIARALSARSLVDVNLLLDSFSFRTAYAPDWSDEYDYLVAMLRGGEDEALHELDVYLRRDPEGAPPGAEEDQIWRPGSFRLFISHTSAHKARAARLATLIERIGVHGFVAHDSIEPTQEWQNVIEKALLTCDAMCAMVTSDFRDSNWCDQEVGFVVAQRKLVLPLKLGADPHGFIGKYQAIPSSIDPDVTFDDVQAMLLAMARHPTTSAKAAPVVVRRYVRSNSFDAAREGFALLQAIPAKLWTPGMIDEIDQAHATNRQLINANLPGSPPTPIPRAVNALLQDLRPAHARTADDDDIPF